MSQPYEWYVLAEATDGGTQEALMARTESALSACIDAGLIHDVALASSTAQAQALWNIRETIPEAQFSNVKHDISVPISCIGQLVDEGMGALRKAFPSCVGYIFGHIGDGNLHYNIGMPSAEETQALIARRAEVNAVLYAVVEKLNGSISAEHGLGQLKREEIQHHKSALELTLMKQIKAALDPNARMNPGKVL